MSAPVSPRHHVVRYTLDTAAGWYVKEPQRIAFGKMPQRLKVEETQEPIIRANGAREVIHGPQVGGKWPFFTGLVPFGVSGWHEGNAYTYRSGQGVRSLVLFRFAPNDSGLTVYYFNGWYLQGREQRHQFARDFARYTEQTERTGNGNGGH